MYVRMIRMYIHVCHVVCMYKSSIILYVHIIYTLHMYVWYIHMNLHKILSLLNHCSKVNGSGSCPSAIGVIKRDGEGDCCGVD